MRVRYVVEGKDSPAELEEKVCAEGDESPEGELECGQRKLSTTIMEMVKVVGQGIQVKVRLTKGTTSSWIF